MPDTVPAAPVLRVSAKLIKAISSIRAEKNIDADGLSIQVDRPHNFVCVCHMPLFERSDTLSLRDYIRGWQAWVVMVSKREVI